MKVLNIIADNRDFQRTSFNLSVPCVNNSSENIDIAPCEITDLSPQGISIRIDKELKPGDRVNIVSSGHILPAVVVRSDKRNTGLLFLELTNSQSSYVKRLWRKGK
jgi:hypothetical protein